MERAPRMKILILFFVGACVVNAEARRYRRKNYLGVKFSFVDNELITKDKIKTFISTTLQSTLSAIDEIHDKSDNTFAGITSDISMRTASITANLNEHFRKYHDTYEQFKKDPKTPSCLFESYYDLQHTLLSLQMRTTECRNRGLTEIQLIKKEIDINTNELKNGVRLVIETINNCGIPWIQGQSIECAREKSEKIARIVTDIQNISSNAHKNILNRVQVILKETNSCADEVIKTAKYEESRVIKAVKSCAASTNFKMGF